MVLHSLQRGLKGKVVKMARTPMTIQPLKHIQHSHHDCHHSGATTVTSPTSGATTLNLQIISRRAFPSQVTACPEHLVSLTSICYFLRKSYAEHSCKFIGRYNFTGFVIFAWTDYKMTLVDSTVPIIFFSGLAAKSHLHKTRFKWKAFKCV